MIIDEIPDLPEGGYDVLENVFKVQNKETHPTKEYVISEKPKESGEKNAESMLNNTKGDQYKDKMSNWSVKSMFCAAICCCSFPYLLCS